MTVTFSDLESMLHLTASGEHQAAHRQAMTRLLSHRQDVPALCIMAQIAADHGNLAKARELFQQAAQIEPDNPAPFALDARSLSLRKERDEASALALRSGDLALLREDTPAFISDMIGVVLSRCGLHERALPHFERSIAANPDRANPHFNFAASLQFSGHFEKAETHFERAVSIDPGLYRAWSSLVSLRKQTVDKNYLTRLTHQFEASEDADARLHLGHAIAKTLEDMGRMEESLDWLHRAKELKKKELNYDIGQDRALFAASAALRPDIAEKTVKTNRNPIFVAGLPRTGTTLVDRILSSHSQVASMGELNIFAEEVKRAAGTDSPFVLDAETLMAAGKTELGLIGQRYLDRTADLSPDATYVVDKMPLNFFQVPLILAALPMARVIILRRGAMDSCLSNYRQLLSTAQSYYGYTFDLQDTAEYYREFDHLMSEFSQTLPNDRFMQIRYEDIVFDQETQTRQLLNFCGLDFEEACLRFHENAAPVSTASSVQVRQPLYSGSIGRWKRYGDKLNGLRNALGDLV